MKMITSILFKKMARPTLDKAEGPHQVGESVKGFAYTDMKQAPTHHT